MFADLYNRGRERERERDRWMMQFCHIIVVGFGSVCFVSSVHKFNAKMAPELLPNCVPLFHHMDWIRIKYMACVVFQFFLC